MDGDKRDRAVVLLSGGLDSMTVMAVARAEGRDLFALTLNYGQRHALELDAAARIARHLGAKQHLVLQTGLEAIGGSALTTDTPVPKGGVGPGIPVTYVPARNTVFLSYALGWAEVLGAAEIYVGVNAVDYSGYPDCRGEYLSAFQHMANLATRASVQGEIKFSIVAPLLKLTKAEIIRKGIGLGLDYSLSWSCYDPTPEGRPCGACDSCRLRAKGFGEAGLPDPLLK